MSDIDEFAEQPESEAVLIQSEQDAILKPLYLLFTPKFLALLLTMVVMVGLISILLYQRNAQISILAETQLAPLTQQLQQIKGLQKAEELVDKLLIAANAEDYVQLHGELISTDRQLLQLSSSDQLIQQWLNKNKSAEDTVSRIQDSYTRNQQLKQNSIIQLQLMLFSMNPIIDKKRATQQSLHTKLQADEARNSVTLSQANTYLKATMQLNKLQNLQSLLAKILVGFEQLTMFTPITSFELLRLDVDQVFIQNKQLKTDGGIKAMLDVHQQMDTFEKIVLTEQRTLAKWQGFIRLAQDYHADLVAQKQQISQLLREPYKANKVNEISVINDVLARFNIQFSDKSITAILIVFLSLSLLLFLYLLWQLREQIRLYAQESVEIIQNTFQEHSGDAVPANCAETQAIIQQIQSLAKPKHNDEDFNALSKKYKLNQKLIKKKKQELARLEKYNEEQRQLSKEQVADYLSGELQRYQYLEDAALSLIQDQQGIVFNKKGLTNTGSDIFPAELALLYQQLTQFHLALEMQSDKAVLSLSDINLIDEIHAILFNQQQQQHHNKNQLFFNCDEQILTHTKIDSRLFEQLINLLIDISLNDCCASQLHLHVQLKDKSAGQQLIRFVVKVSNQSSNGLPSLITQLLDSQPPTFTASPLIAIFNILFAKQHGKNIVAQITDDGYQVSFELPLAIADSTDNVEKITLENTSIRLLSNNIMLSESLEKIVTSAQGKFEHLARIDSFQQQCNAKHLKRHKLELLIVASDIAFTQLDLITQQISNLPKSLQPKLMVLQSSMLSYEQFGFYSQAEQVLCKDNFLHNVKELLASDSKNNQLLPFEEFAVNKGIESGLSLLLAVRSPQYAQNLQRLLHWLGFNVQVVAHELAQQALWQTGQYSLLITEFVDTALLEMTNKPLVDVGVFSLADDIVQPKSHLYFDNWCLGKLTMKSSLTELVDKLAPWIQEVQLSESTKRKDANNKGSSYLPTDNLNGSKPLVITQVPNVLTEQNSEAVFEFSHYLKHQGTAELALYMLSDYTQENHQQLDALIEAIKAKNLTEAQLCISTLTLNAKILSAQELQSLCVKWSKLLMGSEIPTSLNKINSLLKETRIALNKIDTYAETI